tara:strand:+ start:6597 stop:7817 length:1221 start_codon:yes stop_codon:yes gene_type:complete
MSQAYFELENSFRGSRDEIKNKLSIYDGLLECFSSQADTPTVLDIGCGRGEWLELCSQKGFIATGIESNSSMVNECRSNNLNLNILQGNALDLLKNISDQSISIISAFHLIEHLSYEDIFYLFKQCKRIIKNNGVCIFETPSIDNLIVSSNRFYMDPTHVTPINLENIKFNLMYQGFHEVKHYYINGGPLEKDSNHTVTRILNGTAQDLLLIAIPTSNCPLLLENKSPSWESTVNQSITTFKAAEEFDSQLSSNLLEIYTRLNAYQNKINYLENKLESLHDRFYKIYNLKIFKLLRIIRKILLSIIQKVKSLLFNILKIAYRFCESNRFLKFIISPEIMYNLLRIFSFLNHFSWFKFVKSKILNRYKNILYSEANSSLINSMLTSYYKISSSAKRNFEDLSKSLYK